MCSPTLRKVSSKLNLLEKLDNWYFAHVAIFKPLSIFRVTATALRVMGDAMILQDLRNWFTMPQETINVTANWLVTQQDETSGRFVEADRNLNRLFEVNFILVSALTNNPYRAIEHLQLNCIMTMIVIKVYHFLFYHNGNIYSLPLLWIAFLDNKLCAYGSLLRILSFIYLYL